MRGTVTLSVKRRLRDIDVDCTIEEQHNDTLAITEHPVEQGAMVSDHAYLQPRQLVMQIGYSNSSRAAAGDENYVRDKYEELLALQAEREPFSVSTGKRVYDAMLIQGIAVTTDQTTEAVLRATVTLREVILVETEIVTVAPADQHAEPQVTGGVQNGGSKELVPAKPGAGG